MKRKKGLYRVTGRNAALGILLGVILGLGLLIRSAGQLVQTVASPTRLPIYSVETEEKLVALGINCAWDNDDIPQILEILGHYNISASFFLLGEWCDKYPESVVQIHEAGYEIGSHSDSHTDMTTLGPEALRREIQEGCQKIETLTGIPPTLFRPPSGAYNNQVILAIEEEGLFPIQWDCDSLDYRGLSPDEMQTRIFKKLRPGSILLFHSGAPRTPEALPQIIEAIQAEGYTFVSVSQLLYPRPYTVDHEGRQHPADP